jgi:serpin B
MSSKKETQFISVFDDFKVLSLSYQQSRDKKRQFSMYIFLPDAKDGLPALIEKLASESSSLKDKLPRRKVRVLNFGIPKFNISSTFEASNVKPKFQKLPLYPITNSLHYFKLKHIIKKKPQILQFPLI